MRSAASPSTRQVCDVQGVGAGERDGCRQHEVGIGHALHGALQETPSTPEPQTPRPLQSGATQSSASQSMKTVPAILDAAG